MVLTAPAHESTQMAFNLRSAVDWTGGCDHFGQNGSRVCEIWNRTGGGKLTVGIPRRIPVVKFLKKPGAEHVGVTNDG